MRAPAYASMRWIKQDWRFLKIEKNKIIYSKKCGAVGTRTKTGKARLCLPAKVIKTLLRTKDGKQALTRQIRRKLAASKGERVPYDPIILTVFRDFQKNDPFKDKPNN
jgi:hypothetical protein